MRDIYIYMCVCVCVIGWHCAGACTILYPRFMYELQIRGNRGSLYTQASGIPARKIFDVNDTLKRPSK